MQAQCDACHGKAASVFCEVEELALCGPCDHQLHRDNPLTRDHQRSSFFYPVPKLVQICDDCQESKAFIFCREHRAILCRTCDITMHSSDKFMKKHNRFVLNGAKLCTSELAMVEEPAAFNQLKNIEIGDSSSSSFYQGHLMDTMPEATWIYNTFIDDPYGLCKQKGQGSGPAFDDIDMEFLSSSSHENP